MTEGQNNKASNIRSQKKSTIGFLINELGANYFFPMWSGVHDVASKLGINVLLCFPGKSLFSPEPLDRPGNIIYEFVGPENVDGLVITESLTAYKYDPSFFYRYHSVPKAFIGIELEGSPTVKIDNEKGFRDLLIHLIEDHGPEMKPLNYFTMNEK
jgi:DNA-binding LacI/PurR family transcriptional regulator